MKKFTITNADNTKMTVDLVRYFKFKNDCYLIYTLNEIDEKGYIKLYLVKVMEELGFPVINNIKDDKEWAGMQTIVKKVLKEIKNKKRKFLEDLDYNRIQEIKIVEPRFFKLAQNLTEILSSNYNINGTQVDLDKNTVTLNSDSLPMTSDVSESLTTMKNNSQMSEESIDQISSLQSIDDSSNLESIEETLMKQGAFDPIDSTNLISPLQPIEERIEPIGSAVNDTSINMKIDDKTLNNNTQVSDNVLVEQEISNINVRDNQIENQIVESENMGEISKNIVESNHSNEIFNNQKSKQIDYKKLYLAEKDEKEAINTVMNSLIEKLSRYKEKYGELE